MNNTIFNSVVNKVLPIIIDKALPIVIEIAKTAAITLINETVNKVSSLIKERYDFNNK